MNAGTMMVRVAAGIAAVIVLVLSAFVTLGMSLAAPFGVFIGNRRAVRRGRAFTRFASWMHAVAATAVAIMLAIGAVLLSLPESEWDGLGDAIARAEAEQQREAAATTGPAWMRPDPATEKIVTSRAFMVTFGALGGVFACVMFGAIAGTPGWVGTLLLGYAVRGRREPEPPRVPPWPEPAKPKPPEPWEPARIPRDPPPPKPPGQ